VWTTRARQTDSPTNQRRAAQWPHRDWIASALTWCDNRRTVTIPIANQRRGPDNDTNMASSPQQIDSITTSSHSLQFRISILQHEPTPSSALSVRSLTFIIDHTPSVPLYSTRTCPLPHRHSISSRLLDHGIEVFASPLRRRRPTAVLVGSVRPIEWHATVHTRLSTRSSRTECDMDPTYGSVRGRGAGSPLHESVHTTQRALAQSWYTRRQQARSD
jgi:hypothetical protein